MKPKMDVCSLSWRTLLFISYVIAQLMFALTSKPDFLFYKCSENSNYTKNSPFNKNLDNVLASISSNSNADTRHVDYGFYNATSGGDNPNRANAKILCRKGVSLEQCKVCVNDSIRRILEKCPNQKEATGWYMDCQILYSNNSIHGEIDFSASVHISNPSNFPNTISSSEEIMRLLDRLRVEAASGTSIRKSASGDMKLTTPNIYTVYGLVDCFPDMSNFDCNVCLGRLQSNFLACCSGSIGIRLLTTSCQMDYAIHSLYELLLSPPPPASPPLPPTPPPPPALNVSPPSLPTIQGNNTTRTIIIVAASIVSAFVLIVGICIIFMLRKSKHKRLLQNFQNDALEDGTEHEISSVETIQFDFETIKVATDNFSSENKLGQGGFGAVYKGKLSNGQLIAVKRLATNSQQGNIEFKNEVLLVVKLQHRNLVRLLGFCLQGIERLLIYEFVPNGSLDNFIFDFAKRTLLDWEKRYKIINGIARGLLYLHEDSRLRIIHRDLKASNILLDDKMNSKIADFGMSRLFEVDETQAYTSRIVGTYGYMAPEYMMHGQFSVKSDVFSFGVLVLEIVSGQKNNCFHNGEQVEDLSSFAWKNWKAGTTTNVMDSTLTVGSRIEMLRCIHIGLLCVQETVTNRPTMSSVVLMLSSSSLSLPMPSNPAFLMHSDINESSTVLKLSECSENEASITDLHPR